jgi:hypothetical protein
MPILHSARLHLNSFLFASSGLVALVFAASASTPVLPALLLHVFGLGLIFLATLRFLLVQDLKSA